MEKFIQVNNVVGDNKMSNSEILCEIRNRLVGVNAVINSNGSIKSGEDVRNIFKNLNVSVTENEEKDRRKKYKFA